MRQLLLRWAINALAIYLAVGTGWLAGIHAEDTSAVAIFGLALVFGLVNALIRPVLKVLTCPFILATLGLFTIVINAAMLWLTAEIGAFFNIGLAFDTLWWILIGSVLISVVSSILSLLLREELERG